MMLVCVMCLTEWRSVQGVAFLGALVPTGFNFEDPSPTWYCLPSFYLTSLCCELFGLSQNWLVDYVFDLNLAVVDACRAIRCCIRC